MKLLGSSTSPYVRKLRVIAAELALQLDYAETAALEDPAALLAANPLGKVPALILDDGSALFDSPVIAAYLLTLAPNDLVPAAGMAHWQARTTEAIVDGILDAAIVLRFNLEQGVTSGMWVDRQFRAIDRGLAALAGRVGDGTTYAELCAVIVCEYLDLRWPAIDWRAHPALKSVHERLAELPSLASSRPA
ncbi:MAG: glutathione S-transferase N-terminal domain-containing protein [Polymorphobacter sp.]